MRRDYFGRCIELVVREKVPRGSLPSVVQAALPSATHGEDKQEELYTHVRKSDGKWTAYQEVGGMEVPDTRDTYPADSSPWLPLRFIKRRGLGLRRQLRVRVHRRPGVPGRALSGDP